LEKSFLEVEDTSLRSVKCSERLQTHFPNLKLQRLACGVSLEHISIFIS